MKSYKVPHQQPSSRSHADPIGKTSSTCGIATQFLQSGEKSGSNIAHHHEETFHRCRSTLTRASRVMTNRQRRDTAHTSQAGFVCMSHTDESFAGRLLISRTFLSILLDSRLHLCSICIIVTNTYSFPPGYILVPSTKGDRVSTAMT
jgi:hypothetical protein